MNSLEGHFLIAMPNMDDENFEESVIFVVGHGEEGAMGLVVNRALDTLTFADVLDELELGEPDSGIQLSDEARERTVLSGGPVEKGRGFVLHTGDYTSGNTYKVSEGVSLTATLDVMRAMAFGPAPQRSLFALGCCGWSPGQLEDEIAANGWLTIPYDKALLFDIPLEERYQHALASLKITAASLSSAVGHG